MANYRKRNYRKKVVPSKKKVIRKALEKRSNMKIAKVVKNVMSKQIETKVLQFSGDIDCRTLQASTNQTQFEATSVMLTP